METKLVNSTRVILLFISVSFTLSPLIVSAGPPNSISMGDTWICQNGFKRVGDNCEPIYVPENAIALGDTWMCINGYKKVGERCHKIFVPANATAIGDSWICNNGFKKAGNECVSFSVPPNASAVGDSWICNKGYKFNAKRDSCVKMSAQESVQQEMLFRQYHAGKIGNPCDRAYNKCVSDCPNSVHDNDRSIDVSNTDVSSKCEEACRRGRRYCEDESAEEQCYEFKRKCRNECSTAVYNYDTSEYLYSTNFNSLCEDACRSGERACE